ncbi:hypothetical protein L596_008750 [Steinernema carpocapsae]|uniref:Uncharacterized protein n=1 Tax=Steinernema carpocapsae TaxID=34508 RepID=A0A4U5PEJ5_STECR|nr:hypothetical protein L596_008750 [Steinernema carpocapsae]
MERAAIDRRGSTPLHVAAKKGDLETCKLYAENGFNMSPADNYGATPLHVAAREGHTNLVEALIRLGADPDIRDAQGRTAVFHACLAGKASTLQAMISRMGFSIDSRGILSSSLLHAAAFAGKVSCIERLVECGAYVSATDKDDLTPLHIAAERGHLDCCRRLVSFGAPVNALSQTERQTPLSSALINGHAEIAEFLSCEGGLLPEELLMVAELIAKKKRKRHFFFPIASS